MKTVNPEVMTIRVLKSKPYQDKNGCRGAWYGKVARSMPWVLRFPQEANVIDADEGPGDDVARGANVEQPAEHQTPAVGQAEEAGEAEK